MKTFLIIALVLLLFLTPGCNTAGGNEYRRYSDSVLDTFDTLVRMVAYTRSEEEFRMHFETVKARLHELHTYYDIYNDYDGINNIKTINDNAGIGPVKVEQEIIDLILFCLDMSERTGGSVNIALGPVLKIWHTYREEAIYNPEKADLPPLELLVDAFEYSDLDQVVVDQDEMTVFLPDSRMSLDVGAVAKGFALELVVSELVANGLTSAIISIGGNVKIVGPPVEEERNFWGIGIQDPDASIIGGPEKLLDVIYLSEGSVDSSGDYQRFYMFEGRAMHHLINPQTLMPAEHYRSVTVIASDAGLADFMSTALFIIPFEESLALAESLENFEALWVMPDGQVRTTAGMQKMLKSYGATYN